MEMTDNRPEIMAAAIDARDFYKILELLRAGFDHPVVDPTCECPYLWSLQIPGDTPDENRLQLEIARELLRNGDSPTLVVDGETLLDAVCHSLFNDDMDHETMEYTRRFLILLIAYGGSTDYCTPKLNEPFDQNALDRYRFLLFREPDGYHLHGEMWDEQDNVIATV